MEMKILIRPVQSLRRCRYAGLVGLLGLFLLVGCEQPLGEGITYHKTSTLWPIFDVEKIEGVQEDGTHWKQEKGDAVAWMMTWEKEERYDKDNFLIYEKKNDAFLWGLFSSKLEETEQFRHKKGNVLFWPYDSRRVKTVADR
ncbi:MAG: hypothetical protein JW810_05875 [Sedimentisphaerales bacterium]|nr:hypothetical protein [Sedimentisphaerales bacterium]